MSTWGFGGTYAYRSPVSKPATGLRLAAGRAARGAAVQGPVDPVALQRF
jgi:hypothetical protein